MKKILSRYPARYPIPTIPRESAPYYFCGQIVGKLGRLTDPLAVGQNGGDARNKAGGQTKRMKR